MLTSILLFRELMKGRHKAYESVAHWISANLKCASEATYILGVWVQPEVRSLLAVKDWYAHEYADD